MKIVFFYLFLSKTKYFVYFITKNDLSLTSRLKLMNTSINLNANAAQLNYFSTNPFVDFFIEQNVS